MNCQEQMKNKTEQGRGVFNGVLGGAVVKHYNKQVLLVDVAFCVVIISAAIFFYCFYPCLSSLSGDGGDGHYAIWAANAKMLHNGELPLWNPYNWGGYSDVGHIHEVFYPILVLLELIFWDSATQTLSFMVFPAYIAIHMCIGALGMYTCCRIRKKTAVVSFVIAELVTISGCYTYGATWAYIFGSYCWITWLFVTLYCLVKHQQTIWIVLSGLVLAMIGLCSSAQGILFAVLIYGLIFVVAIWHLKTQKKRCIKMTGEFLLSGFLGMGLASIEAFPFCETIINGYRYVPGIEMSESSGKVPLSLFKEMVVDADAMCKVFNSYFGAVALSAAMLLLIVIGFFVKGEKEDWFKNFSKILLIGSFLYTIGFGVADVFWYIPGFNAIREPILYAPFIVMGGGVLAADALEIITEALDKSTSRYFLDFINLKTTCVLLLICIGVICCLPHMMNGKIDIINKIILITIALILITHIKINKVFVCIIMLVVVTLNYGQFLQANKWHYTPQEAAMKINNVNQSISAALSWIDAEVDDGDDSTTRYSNSGFKEVLPSNVAGVIGQKEICAYLNPISQKASFTYHMLSLEKKVQLQNIKYVLFAADNEDSFTEWLETVLGQPSKLCDIDVYSSYDSIETKKLRYIDTSDKNLGCGWIVNNVFTYAGSVETKSFSLTQEFFSRLNNPEFDLSKMVYVDTDTVTEINAWEIDNMIEPEYIVTCTGAFCNKMIYEVTSSANGVFITSEFYYPGWQVKIDGKKSDLFCVDYAFRGVYLSEGTHIVEMYYFPMSLKIGIVLGVVSVILIIFLLGIMYRSKYSKGHVREHIIIE